MVVANYGYRVVRDREYWVTSFSLGRGGDARLVAEDYEAWYNRQEGVRLSDE